MERNPFETEPIKTKLMRLAKKLLEIKKELSEICQKENKFFKAEEEMSIKHFFNSAYKYFLHEQQTKKFEKNFDLNLLEYFQSVSYYEAYEDNKIKRDKLFGQKQITGVYDDDAQISHQDNLNSLQKGGSSDN